jgi:hypothetical protein
MLSKVSKLNAILFLLLVNASRANESFKAYINDILYRLH